MTTKFVHHVTKKPMPVISMADVKSSQVKQVGYDPATKTLAVQFAHGRGAMYQYTNVDPATYQDFLKSESKGQFFGKHLKTLPFEKFIPHVEEKAATA